MSSPDPALLELLDQVGLRRNDVAELLVQMRRIMAADVAEAIETEIPTIAFTQLEVVPGDSADTSLRSFSFRTNPPVTIGRSSPSAHAPGTSPNTTPNSVVEAIKRRGCVIVKGTFERELAEQWNGQIGGYLAGNQFERVYAERYPDLAEAGARIWGIYWSLPQVQARQHERMVTTRRFLNSLWSHESQGVDWFDPDHDIGYPDRLRRRAPGSTVPGLRPHSDSPSAGGWRVAENIDVFRHVLAGNPERYDPWDAAHRTTVDSEATVPATVPATVFRTFQGWTALSEMHPSDGVLHLAATPNAAAYTLVTGIAAELGIEAEPEPAPRRARPDDLIIPALRPIPAVEPGDTVWWHGDIFHSVAPASNDTRWGNVMYIGSSPRCARNERYAGTTLERFERGTSPLDFPTEDFEIDFDGRAGIGDLNDFGRQQFGLEPIR